jgi:hypothetical protein
LAVAYGGTGATNASTALTNLGAYPASNPDGFTNNVGTVTSVGGTGTVNGISLSGTVTNTGNLTLGGSLSGVDLTSQVTNVLPIANGGTAASTASTARTNLGAAASGANTDITSVALTTGTITTTPTNNTDIVNKAYADSIASGINFHAACQWATTVDLGSVTYNNGSSGVGATLTNAGTQAALVIDGHTFTATDVTNATRVLVKNESNAAYNGVYTVTNQGSVSTNWVLTRATDYDTSGSGQNEIDQGDYLLVIYGSVNANTSWIQQTALPITVGTTGIVFLQFGAASAAYTAGTGLNLVANQFSIANTGTAGTYGSASSVPVITTNAQGQVTGVTPTSIAISGSAVSGNIAGNAANVTGTVAIGNGGTGQITQQAAINALAGATTSGSYLRGNGSNVQMSAIQASDVPTLNQNTTGTAAGLSTTLTISSGGTGQTTQQAALNAIAGSVTSGSYLRGNGTNVSMSSIQASDVPTLNQNTTGTAAGLSTTLAITSGGTGQTTASAAFNALSPITTTGDLILGNGTNSATRLPIGSNTYVLTSNGTTAAWAPAASGSGTVTSVDMSVPSFLSVAGNPITSSGTLAVTYSGTALPIANGGTGQTTKTNAFDGLSPTTTKGDLIVYDGTDNVRLPVGTDTYVLTADATQTSGVKWAASSGGGVVLGSVVTTAQGWNMV